MNEALAAKSRDNTELQIRLADLNKSSDAEIETYKEKMETISLECANLNLELENVKKECDIQFNQIIQERNAEVTRLNSEITSYAVKYDESVKNLNHCEAKIQALEECLDAVKKKKDGDFKDILDIADLKADLLATTKEKSNLHEKLQHELESKNLLEDRVKSFNEEMSTLQKELSAHQKDKLEAQTRLEILSTYFKEKESQLQQELSVKEARWMQQQGETTSTVEKVQSLNDEIQALK
jgi:chromosome segregation ATPase